MEDSRPAAAAVLRFYTGWMRLLWACLFSLPLFAADIAIAPQSLTFWYPSRFSVLPPNQGIVLASTQPFPFTVSRPNDAPWLFIGGGSNPSTFTGTGPGFVPIAVDPGALGPGPYTSALTVRTSQGAITVPVTLQVTPGPIVAPILWTDRTILGFDPTTTLLPVSVALTNGAVVVPSVFTSTPWITARSSPTSGTITVAADLGASKALAAGSVQVSGFSLPAAANNPLTIPVVLMPAGFGSPAPLTATPAALTFTGSESRQVTVAGPAFTALPDARWLTVFQNGQTLIVSANAAGMAAGTYRATVTLNADGVLQALPVTLTLGPPNLVKVVNAASYAEGAIAPGEVVLLGGSNLGPGALAGLALDSNGSVATSLAGVRVTFNGVAAPLVYVSATQVAAVTPYDLDGATSAAVQVTVGGQTSNTLTIPVTAAAPGIFTADASGTGTAASFRSGDAIAIYMTGEGQTNPAGVNGKVTGTPPIPKLPVTATIGGSAADVLFAGEAPGIVSGVMQVNLRLPTGRSGDLPVVISVGGVPTQAGVTVSIR